MKIAIALGAFVWVCFQPMCVLAEEYISPRQFPGQGEVGSGHCSPTAYGTGASSSDLTIVDCEEVNNGTQCIAKKGAPPYKNWQISGCGTISNSGQVTNVSGCCGVGTVSVEDAAGNKAVKIIRYPLNNSQWVKVGQNECFYSDCFVPYYHTTHEEISGGTKKVSQVIVACCMIEDDLGLTGTCPPDDVNNIYYIDGLSGNYCEGSHAPYGGAWFRYWGERVVYWYTHANYSYQCK